MQATPPKQSSTTSNSTTTTTPTITAAPSNQADQRPPSIRPITPATSPLERSGSEIEADSSEPEIEVRRFPAVDGSDDVVLVYETRKPARPISDKALKEAVEQADLARLQALLSDHPEQVNLPVDGLGHTLLVTAITLKHDGIVRFLLDLPETDIDAQGPGGRTALHAACMAGEHHLALELIRRGAKVDTQDRDSTPLTSACMQGDEALARQILKRAPARHVNHKPFYGPTAMTAAIIGGHLPVVKLLVKFGARTDQAGQHGRTPLYQAVHHGRLEIAEWLIRHGAAHAVGWFTLPMKCAVVHDSVPMVALLCRHAPKNILLQSDLAREAIDHEALQVLAHLLRTGTGLDPDMWKAALLLTAVQNDKMQAARVLIEHGADAASEGFPGVSALSVLIKKEKPMDWILMLLSAAGKKLILDHDLARQLVRRARQQQDFRILNELAARQIEDCTGQPFDLQKTLRN